MNMRGATIVAAGACLLALAAFSARPQAAPGKAAPARAADSGETRTLEITFEEAVQNESDGTGEYKKAIVHDGDTVIYADLVKLNRKTRTAVATGNLRVVDPQADVTGEKADIFYARAKRLVVLTGNVHIAVKPKQEPAPPGPAPVVVENGKAVIAEAKEDPNSVGTARKHPADITCDKVEYEYAKTKKHAVLTGNFKVVQKLSDRTRTLTAEHADWYGTEERVLLHAPVHMEDTRGTKGDTQQSVTLFTKEGSESIKMGPGKMTVPVDDADEGEGETPASPPATGQPASPPAKEPGAAPEKQPASPTPQAPAPRGPAQPTAPEKKPIGRPGVPPA